MPISLRLSLFYGAIFIFLGVYAPFWPVWLQAKGMTPEEIAVLLALFLLGKTVFSPLFTMLADRMGERKRLLVVGSLLSFCVFTLFGWVDGFWGLAGTILLFSACWTGMMPLGDSLAMQSARQHGLDYGRLRLWGSLSFIAAAWVGGLLIGETGEGLVLWAITGAIACVVVATLLLPGTKPPAARGAGFTPLTVLAQPNMVLFYLAAALIQASHAVYYSFSTIHWRAAGIGDGTIGALWAEGVAAEVVLFAFAGRFLGRSNPLWLLVIAGLGGTLRWSILALSTDPTLLIASQLLHALTFGLTHLAAMEFITRSVSSNLSATAQGLYSASAFGLGAGLATLLAGPLYDVYAGNAFFAATWICFAGGFLALIAVFRKKSA